MQMGHAAGMTVAPDGLECFAREHTIEVAATLRVALGFCARKRWRSGRRLGGCRQSAVTELQLASEKHIYAEELRGRRKVRQHVVQEVYLGFYL